MSKASWLIRDKEFYKRLFLLALPLAGQSILTFSVNLADNIMVGQLGDTAISRVYMANHWNNLLQKFVQGFCTASLVIATQYWGRRDTDSIKTISAMTAKFCLTAGLIFFLMAFVFPKWLLGMYTTEEVIALGRVLGLPENLTVSALLPMGSPAENAAPLPLHSQYRDLADTVAEI